LLQLLLVAQLTDLEVNPSPFLTNTCYSYVSDNMVVHVASVHQFNVEEKTYKTVPGSGGVSSEANTLEATYAWNWAQNIMVRQLALKHTRGLVGQPSFYQGCPYLGCHFTAA
jgi:hypothetical protein